MPITWEQYKEYTHHTLGKRLIDGVDDRPGLQVLVVAFGWSVDSTIETAELTVVGSGIEFVIPPLPTGQHFAYGVLWTNDDVVATLMRLIIPDTFLEQLEAYGPPMPFPYQGLQGKARLSNKRFLAGDVGKTARVVF